LERLIIVILVFLSAMIGVNAPSIGPGYGFIVMASTIALLVLPPRWAFTCLLAGYWLALPLIYFSGSMFVEIAILASILWPVVVYVSAVARVRVGELNAILLLSAITPLVTTTAGILYYGEDGMHSALSIFNVATIMLTWIAYRSWKADRLLGLIGFVGVVLFIAGSIFFYSHATPIGVLATLISLKLSSGRYPRMPAYATLLILLIAGTALGWSGLAANARILLYPLDPDNYTGKRWILDNPCINRTNAMQGIHDPERLRIVHQCITVTGIVAEPPIIWSDGDYTFDLIIHNTSKNPVTTIGNKIMKKNRLHIEIIPIDQQIITKLNNTICKGDKLTITGIHVIDTDHAQWAEIHPALDIKLLKRGDGPCTPTHINPNKPTKQNK